MLGAQGGSHNYVVTAAAVESEKSRSAAQKSEKRWLEFNAYKASLQQKRAFMQSRAALSTQRTSTASNTINLGLLGVVAIAMVTIMSSRKR